MMVSRKISVLVLLILLWSIVGCTKVEAVGLDIYTQALDRCWQKWDTKNTMSDAEVLDVIKQTQNCMRDVGYLLIDRFYSKYEKQMKQNLDMYIHATNQIEKDICIKSDVSFQNFTSIKEVNAASSSLHLTKLLIKDMIETISWEQEEQKE